MYNETWDKFFGNPVLSTYLTEAQEGQPQAEQPQAEQPQAEQPQAKADPEQLEQLTVDLKDGSLTQDDIISMYKSGKLSKDDIQQIVQGAEDTENTQKDQPTDENGEPQLTEEELFAQQLDQTNDMFIKFALYDKTSDLIDKLNYFKENFNDVQAKTYQKVLQLREFLNILSNLIFSIETTVAYQMYGSILLQLTEIFNDYKNEDGAQQFKDKIKDKEKEGYRDGSKTADPVEKWANDNKSSEMPENSSVHQMTSELNK